MLRPTLTRLDDGVGLWLDQGAVASGTLVAFSDRTGGSSRGPFSSLNISSRVGDHPSAVFENRRRIARSLNVDAGDLTMLRQVHGADVIETGTAIAGIAGAADALVTRDAGPVLTVMTADCAPVIMLGTNGIAAAHAGWRGLVAGVIAAAADRIGDPIAAWIGPAIGPCCYEVGPDVISAFNEAGLPVAGTAAVDPGEAARAQLESLGFGSIARVEVCTSCGPDLFSYRRDGDTGRQGAFVARLGE